MTITRAVPAALAAALLLAACSTTTPPAQDGPTPNRGPLSGLPSVTTTDVTKTDVIKTGENSYEAWLTPDRAAVADALATHYGQEYGLAPSELDVHCPSDLAPPPSEMTCVLYSQRQGYATAELTSLTTQGAKALVRFGYSW